MSAEFTWNAGRPSALPRDCVMFQTLTTHEKRKKKEREKGYKEKKDGWLNMADFHSSTTTDNQLVKMLIHSKPNNEYTRRPASSVVSSIRPPLVEEEKKTKNFVSTI